MLPSRMLGGEVRSLRGEVQPGSWRLEGHPPAGLSIGVPGLPWSWGVGVSRASRTGA